MFKSIPRTFRSGLLIGLAAVVVVAAAAITYIRYDTRTLKRTVNRGELYCGVNQNLPGFSTLEGNTWTGFDVDFCRAIASAIFDDPKLTVNYVGSGVVIGRGSDKKSMEPPPVRKDVFQPLDEVMRAMWPGVPVIPIMSTGASDSIYTMAAGIPSYGISGMGVDYNDDRAHGRDERIRVEAFYQGVEFRYLYMKALTR